MGAKERLRNHFWANSAYDPEADSDAKWADDTLAEVESEARAQVLAQLQDAVIALPPRADAYRVDVLAAIEKLR